MGHARAIVSVENIDLQLTIFKKAVADDLSVRKVESLVKKFSKEGFSLEKRIPRGHKDLPEEFKRLQTVLSSHFGTKIELNSRDGEKGEIKIPYLSIDDLNRILEILEIQL
jgi:ParB family chromosome partitioning protein